MNLSPVATKVIEKLILDAKTGDESKVTSLWNNILPKFNINIDYGYSINSEYPTKNGDKADIVIINILQNNKVVLVIECKSIKHDNRNGWDMATTQIYKYLGDLNCNYGIIAIGHKCKFISKNDNFITDIQLLQEYNWEDNYNNIFEKFNTFLQQNTF
jgi:hypothetical protein